MNVQTYSAGFVNRDSGPMVYMEDDLQTGLAGAAVGMVITAVVFTLLVFLA